MKRFFGRWGLGTFLILLLCDVACASSIKDDMHYWGYSNELGDYVSSVLDKTHRVRSPGSTSGEEQQPGSSGELVLDDADAVTEQLAELGRTRSLTPDMPDSSQELGQKVEQFWEEMTPGTPSNLPFLSAEKKTELKENISAALQKAGFEIKQLDLINSPPNLGVPQVRAVVRVVRPLTTPNGYQEIQNSLSEIKNLCLNVTTINGIRYLCELTTFMAENPRNKYFYEKTILNP